MADSDPPDGALHGTSHVRQESGADEDVGNDLKSLAQDWITIWQSEMAAAATDREAREAWQDMISLWINTGADAANLMASTLPDGFPPSHSSHASHDGRAARTAAPSRPTPAHAPPDARDAEVERLSRRVAELERRLADLERGGR